MDLDTVSVMSSDTHGSLLNRVYELQCIREKEEASVNMKNTADMEKLSVALSNMCQVEEKMEMEEEEEEVMGCEKYSQARARADPVYILHQQQLQLQQQQQQQLIAYSSLVTHQQFCQPQQL